MGPRNEKRLSNIKSIYATESHIFAAWQEDSHLLLWTSESYGHRSAYYNMPNVRNFRVGDAGDTFFISCGDIDGKDRLGRITFSYYSDRFTARMEHDIEKASRLNFERKSTERLEKEKREQEELVREAEKQKKEEEKKK